MVTTSTKDEKKLHDALIDAIEELYGKSNCDKYFLVRGTSTNKVRLSITEKLPNIGINADRIDCYITLSQVGNDVFIKV